MLDWYFFYHLITLSITLPSSPEALLKVIFTGWKSKLICSYSIIFFSSFFLYSKHGVWHSLKRHDNLQQCAYICLFSLSCISCNDKNIKEVTCLKYQRMENEDNLVNRKQVMRDKLKWTKDWQRDRPIHLEHQLAFILMILQNFPWDSLVILALWAVSDLMDQPFSDLWGHNVY